MNKKELEFVLQEGEGFKIEFKEGMGGIDKDMVAFANAEGGRIFLGVDDKARIIGLGITNALRSQVQDIANNCDPRVEVSISDEGNVLAIEVKEGRDKPYKCREGFFLRVGPNSQKMTRDEIINLSVTIGKIRFDEQTNNSFVYPKDFDEAKLDNYLALANLSKIIPTENLLVDLNVAKKNRALEFNNAGVLFFATDPQRFISHSVFTCVMFQDKDGSDIIDRQEVTGNIIGIIEGVMKFVSKNTRVGYRFTGKPQREDVREYPLEAIREAVTNSVSHRDYFESGHNNILKIFPDRITIVNVWLKPKGFKLGKDIFRRNKVIADLLSRIGFVEKIGSGFARMKGYCRKANAPVYKLDVTEKYFGIEFFKSRDYLSLVDAKVDAKVDARLSDKEKKVISFIIQNGRISSSELQALLKISREMASRHFGRLIGRDVIERKGAGKSTYYVLKKEAKQK